ncbi:hypothetical protein Tsubulata_046691, partial [Turnera subulata]
KFAWSTGDVIPGEGYMICTWDMNAGNREVKNSLSFCFDLDDGDINGEVLAQIDRDWRGFGYEIFSDAGKYVIQFGSSDPSFSRIPELDVVRPLTLSKRALCL